MNKLKVVLVLSLFVFAIACGGDSGDVYTQNGVATSRNVQQTTPLGAIVYSKDGMSPNYLADVDSGLTNVFSNARLSNYTNNLEYAYYEVYIPSKDCVLSPVNHTPSFKIVGYNDSYDGSVYDQYNTKGEETELARINAGYKWRADGKSIILAAEMVTNFGGAGSDSGRAKMIVCKEVLVDGVNNGAEHILIGFNDYDYYYQTETHVSGGHPLLPHLVANKKVKTEVIKNDTVTVDLAK